MQSKQSPDLEEADKTWFKENIRNTESVIWFNLHGSKFMHHLNKDMDFNLQEFYKAKMTITIEMHF